MKVYAEIYPKFSFSFLIQERSQVLFFIPRSGECYLKYN